MKIVLDTGILIAALITVETPPDKIYQAWKRSCFKLFTTEWQLEEFRRVSRYPKLRQYITASEAGQMVNALRQKAVVLTHLPTVDLCKDPGDNPILSIALAAEADFLVSGDKRDLLSMQQIGNPPIINAADFLKKIN